MSDSSVLASREPLTVQTDVRSADAPGTESSKSPSFPSNSTQKKKEDIDVCHTHFDQIVFFYYSCMDAPSWSQLLLNSKVSYGLAAKFPRARLYTRRNVRRVWNGIALRAAALTPLLSPGRGLLACS